MLPQEAYDQLNRLYKNHYDITLSKEDVQKEALELMYIFAFSQDILHLIPSLHLFTEE